MLSFSLPIIDNLISIPDTHFQSKYFKTIQCYSVHVVGFLSPSMNFSVKEA